MFSRLCAVLALLVSVSGLAGELKVLYLTGGGYHDYKKQAEYIPTEMAKLANFKFDVKWAQKATSEVFPDEKYADGYDVVIYNFCFAAEKDPTIIERALKVMREGKPTVMMHCSMHTYMASDAWTDCCGLRTRSHDGFRNFTITKATTDHPIVKALPEEWKTLGDELYRNIAFPETSTALLKANSIESKKDHVIAWCHTYGKSKVFGTTLGHDMKTISTPEFIKLLVNGTLWAADKLDKDGKPVEGLGK
ncbi:MAG TPA: ThuA domain-containing protein [Planctomycetota bacterium]|jgi:type 1 glutamine amidotransferase